MAAVARSRSSLTFVCVYVHSPYPLFTPFCCHLRYKLHRITGNLLGTDDFAALLGEGRYTLRLRFELGSSAQFLAISALECIGFHLEMGMARMFPGLNVIEIHHLFSLCLTA